MGGGGSRRRNGGGAINGENRRSPWGGLGEAKEVGWSRWIRYLQRAAVRKLEALELRPRLRGGRGTVR